MSHINSQASLKIFDSVHPGFLLQLTPLVVQGGSYWIQQYYIDTDTILKEICEGIWDNNIFFSFFPTCLLLKKKKSNQNQIKQTNKQTTPKKKNGILPWSTCQDIATIPTISYELVPSHFFWLWPPENTCLTTEEQNIDKENLPVC